MTSLVERLDALQISDKKSRKYMFGYIYRTKKAKQYFLCTEDYMVIPSFDEKKFILCKIVRDKDNSFICFLCDHRTVLDNISQQSKKTSSCIHAKLYSFLIHSQLNLSTQKRILLKSWIMVQSALI